MQWPRWWAMWLYSTSHPRIIRLGTCYKKESGMSHVGFRGPHERCTSMMHDHMERMVGGHHEVTIVPLGAASLLI